MVAPSAAAPPRSSGPPAGRRIATAAVMCGMFVSAIEMTIVGTAMPRIAGALGGSDRFTWVISIYLLTTTVSAPLFGKLADVFGRKPTYQAAMVLFLLGSALSGAATSMNWLIAARALQGIGGGGLGTVALTIIGDLYSPVERGRVQALSSAVWGISGALGPIVGGLVVDHLGWRWIFYLNLPFGGAALALLAASLREKITRREVALDWAGAALLTAAIAALQLAGEARGGLRAYTGALAAVGLALLGAFVLVERRARAPIVPLALLSQRLVSTALLASLLSGAVMFGLINFLPLYLQGVQGASARAAGAVMTPLSVAWPITGFAAGFLIARLDARVLVRVGTAVVTAGAALPFAAGALGAHDPRAAFLGAGLLVGAGMGLSSTPLLIALQSAVAWESRGIVTAAFSFCRTMGGTLGVVAAGAIQSARLEARGVAPATVDAMLRPGAPLGSAAARDALAYAVHGAFAALAVGGVVALLAALAFPNTRLTMTRTSAPPAPPVAD